MSDPPDEVTNETRADWAAEALSTFAKRTGDEDEDLQTQVQDLTANLLHLCHLNNVDVVEVLRMSIHHYECEREEEEEQPCRVNYERAPWMESAEGIT